MRHNVGGKNLRLEDDGALKERNLRLVVLITVEHTSSLVRASICELLLEHSWKLPTLITALPYLSTYVVRSVASLAVGLGRTFLRTLRWEGVFMTCWTWLVYLMTSW